MYTFFFLWLYNHDKAVSISTTVVYAFLFRLFPRPSCTVFKHAISTTVVYAISFWLFPWPLSTVFKQAISTTVVYAFHFGYFHDHRVRFSYWIIISAIDSVHWPYSSGRNKIGSKKSWIQNRSNIIFFIFTLSTM